MGSGAAVRHANAVGVIAYGPWQAAQPRRGGLTAFGVLCMGVGVFKQWCKCMGIAALAPALPASVCAHDALAVQAHAKALFDARATSEFERWQAIQWGFAARMCMFQAGQTTATWLKSKLLPRAAGTYRIMPVQACKALASIGPKPVCWNWQSYQPPFSMPFEGVSPNYLFLADGQPMPASGSRIAVGAKCMLSEGARETEQFFAGQVTIAHDGKQMVLPLNAGAKVKRFKQMSVRLTVEGYRGAQPILNMLQQP